MDWRSGLGGVPGHILTDDEPLGLYPAERELPDSPIHVAHQTSMQRFFEELFQLRGN